MLARRCRGGRSDNTSLLRLLEYPPLEGASEGTWGVSAHTDYEVFSLLHEKAAGLELQAPSGEWHAPAPETGSFTDGVGADDGDEVGVRVELVGTAVGAGVGAGVTP